MKHRTVIATLCVVAMCVAGCSELPSLGSGSTDQQRDIEKEREAYYKIGEEAFAFVGTWDMQGGNDTYHCIFYPDGVCKVMRIDKKYGWELEGVWTYNPQTMMLATTVEDYSWMVTVVGEDAWAGIRQRSKQDSQSFTRIEVQPEALFTLAGTWACGEDILEIGYGSWGVGEREVDIVGRSYRDYGITDSTVTELGPELELRGSGTWTLYDLEDWRISDVEKIVPLGENDIAYELRETIENSSTGPQFLVMTISDDGLYISKLRKIYYWYVVNELHSRVDEYTRVVE